MSPLGIVSALKVEARHLCPGRLNPSGITPVADGTLLTVSGMGIEAARRAARSLIEAGAGALLSFGVAGGLDPALQAGTLCLPAEVVDLTGGRVPTAAQWRSRVKRALSPRIEITEGALLTSPTTLNSIEEKAQAFQASGAVTVDMESLGIGQEARQAGLPFLAVRVIVDTAADTLPPVITRLTGPDGQVPLARLLGALAVHPGALPAVIRLGARFRAASRSLAAAASSGALHPKVAA